MPVPPDSYVARMHAAVSTPRAVLAALVDRAVGTRIAQVERIVEGYDNEVYRISCRDGQEVVIRILRFGGDLARATGEAGTIDRARSVGVPAPEVLLVDTVEIEGSTFPVMVQRAVPGRPLADVFDHLSHDQQTRLLRQVGELIGRLQEIGVDGDRGWHATRSREITDRRGQRDQIIAGGFSEAQFALMMALLQEHADDVTDRRWVLCHGDLSPKHLFVRPDGDDIRVSGVIDFGDWKVDAPVHDLAVLRVRGIGLPLTPLLSGYGAPTDTSFHRRLDLHTLNIALSSLWIGVDEGDADCIRRSRGLIQRLVADLRHPPRVGAR